MTKQLLGKIDAPLFKRQRLALIQAIEDSPHPLRTELLTGLLELTQCIADELESDDADACSYCGGDCKSDEDNACDGYLGDIDGLDAAVRAVVNPAPKITSVKSETANGSCTLTALFTDFSERRLFSFYVDELCFSNDELIGLTEAQAHELRHSKDVAYLRS